MSIKDVPMSKLEDSARESPMYFSTPKEPMYSVGGPSPAVVLLLLLISLDCLMK